MTPHTKKIRKPLYRTLTVSATKQGDIAFEYIVIAVLGLLVLTVMVIAFMKSMGNPFQLVTKTEYITRAQFCQGPNIDNTRTQEITLPCDPTPQDKDGDCLLDTCDPCIDTTKPQAKSGPSGKTERQARGSQAFDKDQDGIPDACDSKPLLPVKPTCSWNSEREHCLITIKHVNLNNKPIEITSLGTEEKVSGDYSFG